MRTNIIPALSLVTVLAAPAAAQVAGQPHPGRLLASNCFQCHGTNGRGMEELAGKSAKDIYDHLREMSQNPANTNIMNVQARGYTDAQMRLIADYFSQLPAR